MYFNFKMFNVRRHKLEIYLLISMFSYLLTSSQSIHWYQENTHPMNPISYHHHHYHLSEIVKIYKRTITGLTWAIFTLYRVTFCVVSKIFPKKKDVSIVILSWIFFGVFVGIYLGLAMKSIIQKSKWQYKCKCENKSSY